MIYPKTPVKSFVTILDYHIDECRKWFKTTMEFKARTYTTCKIRGIERNGIEQEERNNAVNDSNNNVPGPGASQILLPRWNKENDQDIHIPVTGELIMNGF